MNRSIILATKEAPTDGVERASDGTPTAFRIWHAGDNATDYGIHKFTEKSAKLLLDSQAKRGNLFSVDVDHMSLNETSPPESRKAVGWFSIEERKDAAGDLELWAINNAWTEAVRAGLTADPPEWRYFSPAYETNKDNEIVRLINLAVTNNPATWSVTALATLRKANMYKEMKAALTAAAGDDEQKMAEAIRCIKAAFPDGDPEEKKDDPEKKDEPKKEEAAVKTAEEPKKDEPKKEEPKDETATKAHAASIHRIGELEREQKEFREFKAAQVKKDEDAERTRVLAGYVLTDGQVKALCAMPLAHMKSTIEVGNFEKATTFAKPASAPARGDSQTTEHRAAQLPAAENHALKVRFGLAKKDVNIIRANKSITFPAMTPEQATAASARREGAAR